MLKLESEGKLRAAQIAEAYVPVDMTEFLQGGEESLSYAKEAVESSMSYTNPLYPIN